MADATRWGDLAFLSGRAPVDPVTFELRADDFESQAQIVLTDVGSVLEKCGSAFEYVLRVECYLADKRDFAAWNAMFRKWFPSSPPSRTTLVTQFAVDGMLIELQVTAGVPA
jgi:2-iminobutanoate/2-iminopropanoate deaminase